jgi:hypothetical protein
VHGRWVSGVGVVRRPLSESWVERRNKKRERDERVTHKKKSKVRRQEKNEFKRVKKSLEDNGSAGTNFFFMWFLPVSVTINIIKI